MQDQYSHWDTTLDALLKLERLVNLTTYWIKKTNLFAYKHVCRFLNMKKKRINLRLEYIKGESSVFYYFAHITFKPALN